MRLRYSAETARPRSRIWLRAGRGPAPLSPSPVRVPAGSPRRTGQASLLLRGLSAASPGRRPTPFAPLARVPARFPQPVPAAPSAPVFAAVRAVLGLSRRPTRGSSVDFVPARRAGHAEQPPVGDRPAHDEHAASICRHPCRLPPGDKSPNVSVTKLVHHG